MKLVVAFTDSGVGFLNEEEILNLWRQVYFGQDNVATIHRRPEVSGVHKLQASRR